MKFFFNLFRNFFSSNINQKNNEENQEINTDYQFETSNKEYLIQEDLPFNKVTSEQKKTNWPNKEK